MDEFSLSGGSSEIAMRMETILNEREEQFRKREELIAKEKAGVKKQKAALDARLEELEKEKAANEAMQQKNLKMEQDLVKKEQVLRDKESQVLRQEAELKQKHEHLILNQRLEVEALRNQRNQLELEREKVEHQQTFGLDLFDPSDYVERSMHEQLIREEREKQKNLSYANIQALEEKLSESEKMRKLLEKKVQELSDEKQKLMERVLGLGQNSFGSETSSSATPKKENAFYREPEEESAGLYAGNAEDVEDSEDFYLEAEEEQDDREYEEQEVDITKEELTASIIELGLKKSPYGFEEVKMLHSEFNEQVPAVRGNLNYRFVLDDPAYFDVYTKKRYSKRLESNLKKLNERMPEFKFTFDEQTSNVYVTGYFTTDMEMPELLEAVRRAASCFKSKEQDS